MKNYYFAFLTSCILLMGCQTNQERSKKNDFYAIDFTQCVETEKSMLLSEIADSIEYLELKTPEDIIITNIINIKIVDNDLIICAKGGVYKFHRNGQFVRKIGDIGQGPGEYVGATDIELDLKNKEIIIQAVFSTMYYDYDGNFLRSKTNFANKISISDSILWTDKVAFIKDPYNAIATSLDGNSDTIATIPNSIYGRESVNRNEASLGFSCFYHHNSLLFYKCNDSYDTILKLSGTKIEPYAYINMGKYKLPNEYEVWYSVDAFNKSGHEYWGIPFIAEDERYIFLSSTTRRAQQGIERKYKYLVYDKKEVKGFTTKNNQDFKITDDILGGPPVWPRWITEKYYINTIEWHELKEQMNTGNYSPAEPLKSQIPKIGEDTNQIIILCHRKNV